MPKYEVMKSRLDIKLVNQQKVSKYYETSNQNRLTARIQTTRLKIDFLK